MAFKLSAMGISLLLTVSLLPARAGELLVDGFEKVNGWQTGGQKEISLNVTDKHIKQGKKALHLHVEIDHKNTDVNYPMGWPSAIKHYPKPIDLSSYDFLELDIYFESRRGINPDFALSIMVKDDTGRDIYRTTFIDLRHGRWAHEKLCIRDIPNADGFVELHFFLSESCYDDGQVIDFYIDNLRATRAADYSPPQLKPVQHLLAASDFAMLWMEGSCRKVKRTEKVEFDNPPAGVVSMSCARNETEAVQLVLSPRDAQGLGEVSLRVSDLRSREGAVIPAENISWSPVVYVPAVEGPPEGLPDALPGPVPFRADHQGYQYPIWLEVHVPPGTTAGDYAGRILIRTGRGDLKLDLKLHVWDFDVPVMQHLRTSTSIYGPYGWCDEIKKRLGDMTYSEFIKNWRPRMVGMLARYRLCPSHLDYLPLEYDEVHDTVVLGDTARFERYIRECLAMGHRIDCMPVPYFFNRPAFLGAEKGTDEYLRRITEAFRVAAEYLETKRWLDGSYVYPADEVVVHRHTRKIDLPLLNRVFAAIHAAHPKIKIFGAEVPSPALRGLDIYCININCFDTDVMDEQHALGKKVWWYNGYRDPRPGTRIAARGVDHRALFWITYKYGIDGYLIWTVNRWVTDPWKQPNRTKRHPAGSHFLLYPGRDGTVCPSIRLCMMRDGLEDYEYHWLLADAARKLKAAGMRKLAEQCERVIREADAFILAYDNCAHIRPEYIYRSRRMLAEQIEKATTALKASR